ncbi:DUF2235 domain-containing protein [Acinetobacter beijerinckii]|uniref:DUF2235 domain-containing protein n=1 Tax=Acinetobacter beijerinckii TaxID=262668 RepID=UPI003AF75E73
MTKKLMYFFDGTWNDPADNTNVYKIYQLIKNLNNRDIECIYDEGVGVMPFTRVIGGFTGLGLNENILDAYLSLSKYYDPNNPPEIWFFGFSRGAYTARSLAGLINKCGLLKTPTKKMAKKAFDVYSDQSTKGTQFRLNNSFDKIEIHFLGVWDTVGALGIPQTLFTEKSKYVWHDTNLSKAVKHGYHAMALDEHREIFNVVLWTSEDGKPIYDGQKIEQRWFIGAHANVGGGYKKGNSLSDISLAWMTQKARDAGIANLTFKSQNEVPWKDDPNDSYKEFLFSMYKFVRKFNGKNKLIRNLFIGQDENYGVNVKIDDSIKLKWAHNQKYLPQSIVNEKLMPPPTF